MPLNLAVAVVVVDNESMIDDVDADDRLVDDLPLMGKITCRIPLDQPWRVMIVWMRMSIDADIVVVVDVDDDERRVVQETLMVCQVRKEMGLRMWYRQLLLHTSLAEYHMARSLSVEIPVAVLLLPLPHLCSCVADS